MGNTTFTISGGRQFTVSAKDVARAMSKYDSSMRKSDHDCGRLYAVRHESKLYPPKQILALALGISVRSFAGGEGKGSANRVFRELGFEVICLDADRIPAGAHDPRKINAPIPSMARLQKELFAQKWLNLHRDYGKIKDGQYPGVYMLAYSRTDIEARKVTPADVFYVGMSHAGIIKRLQQFMAGLEDGSHHSGAKRFFTEHAKKVKYSTLKRRKTFYVVAVALPCVVNKQQRTHIDLRKMGEVARLEFYAIAHIKYLTRNEPPLNRK